MRTKRLGDMLLELGLITEGQLKEALDYQAKEKERLGTTLVKHHYITEGQLIDALRMQLGIDYIDLTRVDISPEMSRFVPKNLAKKMTIVPVRISKDQLYLAMADPLNFMAIEEAQHTSKKKIVPMIASEPAVKRAINIFCMATRERQKRWRRCRQRRQRHKRCVRGRRRQEKDRKM